MDIPFELIDALRRREVVLFVGAGLSYAAGLPDWRGLMTPLAGSIGLPEARRGDLLQVAQDYENRRTRGELLRYLVEATDTTHTVPTDNHRRLARLGCRAWVTTNFDDLIERTLQDAGTPKRVVVRDSDLPYTSRDAVTVVKLHGDRGQPDTLVISKGDYDTFFTRFPLIRGKLQSLLAESTVLFVGYGRGDPDFDQLQAEVAAALAGHSRLAYAVLFDAEAWTVDDLKRRNIHALNLDTGGQPVHAALLGELLDEMLTLADLDAAEQPRPAVRPGQPGPPPPKVSLEKLPITSPVLFGRDAELVKLHEAWDDPQTHVLSLVAWGGVGKTALVNRWLLEMDKADYKGARRVFGWSFYSQGAAEGRQASADQYIDAALRGFGDPDPTAGSPWDKGDRLAALVQRQRTLLVLDGLEPLQYPPGPEEGKLKDPGLAVLLRTLARRANPGLLVVTTRLPVADLEPFDGTTARRIDLEALSPQAGAAYLKHLGVKGSQAERETASAEFDGHALALTLLGTLLRDAYDGDVRRRHEVGPLLEASTVQGAHARRAMAAYERWLGPGPETAILRLMGLFDRPAEAAALAVLRAAPPIPGLSEALFVRSNDLSRSGQPEATKVATTNALGGDAKPLRDREWNLAVARLRRAGLLGDADLDAPHDLDCHPLVREHFAEQVQAESLDGWQAAHGRLYEHYCGQAEDRPDTLAGLAPLFAAVGHGCRADRRQEALERVYWRRIERFDDFYSTSMLGAFGADLAALAGFFEEPWRRPASELKEMSKSWVLNTAGFELRALGRLAEAAEPMRAGLEISIAQEEWWNASQVAGNLSELHLAVGAVTRAVETARQAVTLADRSQDAFSPMLQRTTLGGALHQAGDTAGAAALFAEAETIQRERQPKYPLLYSLQGYHYHELLFTQGQADEVLRRAAQTLAWVTSQNWLLDIALDNVALGRAYALTGDQVQAAVHLGQAVDGLRRAGAQHHLPRGLLARAALRRAQGDLEAATRDLDEALEIATRGGMRLHEADCHLEFARLHLAAGLRDQAQASLAKARALVDATGYHRRDRELAELEEQVRLEADG